MRATEGFASGFVAGPLNAGISTCGGAKTVLSITQGRSRKHIYNTNRNYLAGGSGRLLLILALLHVWNVDCTHISDAIGRFYILVRSLDQNQSIYII